MQPFARRRWSARPAAGAENLSTAWRGACHRDGSWRMRTSPNCARTTLAARNAAGWARVTGGSSSPGPPSSYCGFCPPSGAGRRRRRRSGTVRAVAGRARLPGRDLVGAEGPTFLLADLAERPDEEAARAVVLDTARAVERVPELLGLGPHLLATGVAPLAGLERHTLRMPGPRVSGAGHPHLANGLSSSWRSRWWCWRCSETAPGCSSGCHWWWRYRSCPAGPPRPTRLRPRPG